MHRKTVLHGAVRAIWSLVRYAGALQVGSACLLVAHG